SSHKEEEETQNCLDCLKLIVNCEICRKNKRIFDEVFFANIPNIAHFFEEEKSSNLKFLNQKKNEKVLNLNQENPGIKNQTHMKIHIVIFVKLN
ncbi:MAG: hypothetical protein KDC95_04820, partial [Planctomycetes bacterium]|nr:hypothetical protein [Planctomycetota bacterium]